VSYDHDLADRIREQLADEDAITEKAMFGGLAFLAAGNMSVGVTGDDLIVRVGPEGTDAALEQPNTRLFDKTGRPMKGWIIVGAEGVRTRPQLAAWVRQGLAFARSLPPKT
jgi:TfoX/Sxy family transcriptional regulator of competence genes